MASRNSDGTRKLQPKINYAFRHTGEKISVGQSSDDSVVERIEDTDYRPSQNG